MNTKYKQEIIATRYSTFNKTSYKELFDNQHITYEDMEKVFNDNSKIRESILLASPDLYYAIKENHNDKDKTLNSFIKYFIRMTTRPTPFGLFSGVSFNKKLTSDVQVGSMKTCEVDFKWLFTLITHLEMNLDILFELEIVTNQNILKEKHIMTNPYISYDYISKNKGEKDSAENTSVTITSSTIVEYVLEQCEFPQKFYKFYNDLRQKLGEKIPAYTIVNLLVQLINDEFLYTNLRPTLPKSNSLSNLIDKLQNIKSAELYYKKLVKINSLINEYINCEFGRGELLLVEILKRMENIQKSEKYLQVEYYFEPFDEHSISKYVPNISVFMNTLEIIYNNYNNISTLDDYKNKFIEKYGFERVVPFLEMVDSQIGIGYPNYYSSNYHFTEDRIKLQNMIDNKIMQSIQLHRNEVNLTLNDFAQIGYDINKKSRVDTTDFDNSFDLVFLNSKTPSLSSAIIGVKHAGRVMDRFSTPKHLNNLYIDELKNNRLSRGNIITAELSVIPRSSRCLNITTSSLIDNNNLIIGTYGNNLIDLNNVYVTIKNNKLQLIYQDKLFYCYAPNMINPERCPNIYRVLQDISEGSSLIDSISYIYQSIKSYYHIPKIKLENIILFPETWNIDNESLSLNKNDDFTMFIKKFNIFKQKNHLPNYFYLKMFDNILLLDYKNKNHLSILYNEIRTKQNIRLTYAGQNIDEIPTHEIVVSYFPKDVYKGVEANYNTNYIPRMNYLKEFSSDWIYIKIYAKKYTLKNILKNDIQFLVNKLLQNKLIDKYFYINFLDDKEHIRLRFHCLVDVIELMKYLIEYINYLKRKYDIYNIVFDTYEQEIERYGNSHLIDITETFFYLNSEVCINLFKYNNPKFNKEDIALLEIYYILKILDINVPAIEELFQYMDKKLYLLEFRKNKKHYIELYQSINNNNLEESLFNILKIQESALLLLKKELYTNEISLKNKNIILSHLHMFCNRYFGVDRQIENKMYALIKHTAHTIYGYEKYNHR